MARTAWPGSVPTAALAVAAIIWLLLAAPAAYLASLLAAWGGLRPHVFTVLRHSRCLCRDRVRPHSAEILSLLDLLAPHLPVLADRAHADVLAPHLKGLLGARPPRPPAVRPRRRCAGGGGGGGRQARAAGV